ncbi:MAG: cysteine desulfurase-like protein [Planctomycetota bacterium]
MSHPAINAWPLEHIRRAFPGLTRTLDGRPVAFFDGPAGSQVPESVAQAVAHYLRFTNCNRGAAFATARESDAILNNAHQTVADFLGADDPDCVIFGPNMTSLTLHLAHTLAETWKPGDEILLSQLDHDANVSPWMLAAKQAGAIVRHAPVNLEDGTLDQAAWEQLLGERTRFAAIGYASNATGSVNPVREMIAKAKQVGAATFVDAVHYAPHGRLSVRDLQCDFLACSAYKFFGPHEGILWGRRQLLETHKPWKLRPAPNQLPGLWMTGTQSHEAIAGTAAAIEYIAGIADWLPAGSVAPQSTRSQKLDVVFQHLTNYEQTLSAAFLDGLRSVPGIRIHGIQDPSRLHERVPTFSWTFPDLDPRKAAEWLASRGLCVWNGNAYALPFTDAAALEPLGVIRAGALHYNTIAEIQRLTSALHELRN